MQDLIEAIKAQLQTDLGYVRGTDIFVTENEIMLPAQLRFPAVGIKDGSITYRVATQSQENDTLLVKVLSYVQLLKPEASIMGDAATGNKGVLAMTADIKASLKNNLLGGLADSAWPESERESETLLVDETLSIQMKVLTMRYERY